MTEEEKERLENFIYSLSPGHECQSSWVRFCNMTGKDRDDQNEQSKFYKDDAQIKDIINI